MLELFSLIFNLWHRIERSDFLFEGFSFFTIGNFFANCGSSFCTSLCCGSISCNSCLSFGKYFAAFKNFLERFNKVFDFFCLSVFLYISSNGGFNRVDTRVNQCLLLGIIVCDRLTQTEIEFLLSTRRQGGIFFKMHGFVVNELVNHRKGVSGSQRKHTFLRPGQVINVNTLKISSDIQCSKRRAREDLWIFDTVSSQVSFCRKYSFTDVFFFRIELIHFVNNEKETVTNLFATFLNLIGNIVEKGCIVICA